MHDNYKNRIVKAGYNQQRLLFLLFRIRLLKGIILDEIHADLDPE